MNNMAILTNQEAKKWEIVGYIVCLSVFSKYSVVLILG